MIDDHIRAALKNDIAARLLEGGARRWKEIQSRYPQVSSATFFRLVDNVKAEQSDAVADQFSGPVVSAEKIAAGISQQTRNWAGESAGRQDPVPAGRLIAEIATVFDDANLLRDYALDSRGKVKFPSALVESAKLRDRATRMALDMLTRIYDAAAQAEYFDAITEAVLATDPDMQRRLMLTMHEINERASTLVPKIHRGISGVGDGRRDAAH